MAHLKLGLMPAPGVCRKSTNLCFNVQKRAAHDLTIHRTTGRPIIRSGPGGRHSQDGSVATVFGCTGFLGRYVVHKLAKTGVQVIVPYRGEDDKRHLKVSGDLGQVVPLEWDMNNDTQIEECVRHSDIVINLVGREYETKNYSYHDVNVDGARRIARIAYLSGVSRLIHVSHLNADHDSSSMFYRSKAAGEEAVKEAFSGATIVRPSTLFGYEDRLLNSIASNPLSYRFNGGETKVTPVHSHDVAQAISVMTTAQSSIDSTYSLVGPQTYTYEQLYDIVRDRTDLPLRGFDVPKSLGMAFAAAYQNIWWATYSPDLIKRRFISDKTPEIGTKSFADLGITPESLEDLAIMYLRWYRKSGEEPVDKGGIKFRQRSYHVVE